MKIPLRKKLIILSQLLILLLFPLLISAQDRPIDSLKTIVFSNQADSTRLKAMLSLTWYYTDTDYNKALEIGTKGLLLSQKLNDDKKEVSFLNILGIIYDNQSYGFDTTMSFYNRALVIARTLEDEILVADLQNNMGNVCKRVGQYDKAFELYQNSLDIAERLENEKAACRYLNNMALIMKDRGDFDDALIYYDRGLKFARRLQNTVYIAALVNNVGLVYDELNQLDTALIYYEEALELKRVLNNRYSLVTTLCNIGNVYIQQSKFDQSFSYTSEAYNISKSLNYSYGKALALSNLAELALKKSDYTKAINYSKDGLKVLEVDGDVILIEGFYEVLLQSYELIGDYKNAFLYKTLYHTLEDSVYNIESEKRIEELTTKYKVSQQQSENELLKANEKVNKAVIEKQNWIVFGAFALVFLLCLLLLFIYKNNQKKLLYRKNLEKRVAEKTLDLKTLNQELIERNIELERFNYAASHDMKEPLRSVVSFSTLLDRKEKALSDEGVQYLGFIKQNALQLNFLVDSIREFSNINQREAEIVDLNLTMKTIEADLIAQVSAAKFKLTYDELPKLTGGKTQFFLLFKHLIDNGFRYNTSDVPVVEVRYRDSSDKHIFSIIDNGIGIEEDYKEKIFHLFNRLHDRGKSQKPGMGLATCKKIVNNLDGTIRVESELNKGATFIIELSK